MRCASLPACTAWPTTNGATPPTRGCSSARPRPDPQRPGFRPPGAEPGAHYRVVCPDVVGRSQSGRLRDPAAYGIPSTSPTWSRLLPAWGRPGPLARHLHGRPHRHRLAGLPDTPITRLVLNDVGPVITGESLRRIGEYLGTDPTWASFAEAEAYIRLISAPLRAAHRRPVAPHDRNQRAAAPRRPLGASSTIRPSPLPFKAAFAATDIDLWPMYELVSCPTLAVRGAESDLLRRETWLQMAERGPGKARRNPRVGHAPMFMSDDQVAVVRDFLLAP